MPIPKHGAGFRDAETKSVPAVTGTRVHRKTHPVRPPSRTGSGLQVVMLLLVLAGLTGGIAYWATLAPQAKTEAGGDDEAAAPGEDRIRQLVRRIAKGVAVDENNDELKQKLDAEIKQQGAAAITELTRVLRDGASLEKLVALRFLTRLGLAAGPALPAARELSRDSADPVLAAAAKKFIQTFDEEAAPVALESGAKSGGRVRQLLDRYAILLRAPDADVNAQAGRNKVLAEIKEHADGAVPELVYILRTSPADARNALLFLNCLPPKGQAALSTVQLVREHATDPEIIGLADKFIAALKAVKVPGAGAP